MKQIENQTEKNQVYNMKIKIWMIRHGMTAGNQEQRYVGTTDEPLCEEGQQQILAKKQVKERQNDVKTVYVSPMRRCLETAEILFPSANQEIIEGLKECSFGEFEYRNYRELNGNLDYQAWIDSGGTIGFPGGENRNEFCSRVQKAFEQMVLEQMIPEALKDAEKAVPEIQRGMEKTELLDITEEWQTAMVVHGGTIMAILSKWAVPQADYFHWQVKNGCGYVVSLDTDEWLAGNGRLSVMEKY